MDVKKLFRPSEIRHLSMEKALVELARWSQVATRNGGLHARVASALALSAREEQK